MAIDYSRLPEMFAVGAAGALCIEALKGYELRHRLHLAKYKAVIRSPLFWLASAVFIIVSGIVGWVFNENNPNATLIQLFATGMGTASILRSVAQSAASTTRLTAGEDSNASAKDIFL